MDVDLWLRSKGYALASLLYCTSTCYVYSGSHPNCPICPSQVAIKVQIFTSPQSFERSQREINTMGELRHHPHVIQLFEHFSEELEGKRMLALVMELAQKDLLVDLEHRKKNQYPWREEDLRQVAEDLVDVLALAERMGICHRDIKPQNLFYNSVTKQVKLGDFGSSAAGIFGFQNATVVGTPLYMTSELKQAMLFDNLRVEHDVVKADVYALGITVLALAKLAIPVRLLLKPTESAIREEIEALSYGKSLKSLLFDMVNLNAARRLTFVQLQTKYFQVAAPSTVSHLSSTVPYKPAPDPMLALPSVSAANQLPSADEQRTVPPAYTHWPDSQQNPIDPRSYSRSGSWQAVPAEQRDGSEYYDQRAGQLDSPAIYEVPNYQPEVLPKAPSADSRQSFRVFQMPIAPAPPSISSHVPLSQNLIFMNPPLPPKPIVINRPVCAFCNSSIEDYSTRVSCLACSGAYFCNTAHFKEYVIDVTNQFQRENVGCPNCSTALNPTEVERVIGGLKALQSLKNSLKTGELMCKQCEERKATMVLSCGHITCEKCTKEHCFEAVYFCGICNCRVNEPEELQKNALIEKFKKLLPWS